MVSCVLMDMGEVEPDRGIFGVCAKYPIMGPNS